MLRKKIDSICILNRELPVYSTYLKVHVEYVDSSVDVEMISLQKKGDILVYIVQSVGLS